MLIKKRDGSFESFNPNKIVTAISKAMQQEGPVTPEMLEAAEAIAGEITQAVRYSEDLEKAGQFTVEEVQDLVELKLMEKKLYSVAKKYILYRAKRAELRHQEWEMTELERGIWENRYRANGETFNEWFDRVSGGNGRIKKRIRNKQFLFGGRILANRGLVSDENKCTYSNCYVIAPPEDSIEGIFKAAAEVGRTYSYGGGVGLSIGNLRPKNSKVNNSARATTGAVSFMDLYDLTTKLIGQNGRRGALMISLPVTHPDLVDFIDVKLDLRRITKANISLMMTDAFMEAVKNNQEFQTTFTFESNNQMIEVRKKVNAREVFRRIAENNWRMGEPGMLFWDRIESYHLMSRVPGFVFAGTNPCGEQPLMAYGSCLLGAVNLAAFVRNPHTEKAFFDFEDFISCMFDVTVAMNEVLDEGIEYHPLQEQRDVARNYRQIGIGIMGLGDLFISLGVKYGSPESKELADKIASTMKNSVVKASALLAKDAGPFPAYNYQYISQSPFFRALDPEAQEMVKKYGLRNSQLLTAAPTGSTSSMLGVSGGIEPIFSLSYIRSTHNEEEADNFQYKVFAKVAQEYMQHNKIAREEDLPEFFVVSQDINFRDRIEMQAVWQNHIDASISSTVNLPEEASVQDVEDIYLCAWENGLKGITVFRNNCERQGVLLMEGRKKAEGENETGTEGVAASGVSGGSSLGGGGGAVGNRQEKPAEGSLEITIKEKSSFVQLQITSGLYSKCPSCEKEGVMYQANGCAICSNCGFSPCS